MIDPSDLPGRMRTCVAGLQDIDVDLHLLDRQMEAIIDARKLLIEAADVLASIWKPSEPEIESYAENYQPMIPKAQAAEDRAVWYGDDLKSVPNTLPSRNVCPNCDSRTTKIVRAAGPNIELECPVCGYRWKR